MSWGSRRGRWGGWRSAPKMTDNGSDPIHKTCVGAEIRLNRFRAIYQRIMKFTGEECTFAKFLEYDAVNRGKSQAAVRPPLKLSERREPGAPPVIVR